MDDSVEELIAASQQRAGGYSGGVRRSDQIMSNDNSLFDGSDNDDGGRGGEDFEALFGDGHGSGEEEEEEEEDDDDDGLAIGPGHYRGPRLYEEDEASEDDGFDDDEIERIDPEADAQTRAIKRIKTAKQKPPRIQLASGSGKALGDFIPLKPITFENAYERLCPPETMNNDFINGAVASSSSSNRKRSRSSSSSSSSSLDEEEDEARLPDALPNNGEADRVSNDDTDMEAAHGDAADILDLLQKYNIELTAEIKTAVSSIRENEAKSVAVPTSGPPVSKKSRKEQDGSVHGNKFDEMSNDEIDDYLRKKFEDDLKMAGLSYEKFMTVTCPLCAYGNQAGDVIYAPKLQIIRDIANQGIMRGHLETTNVLVCFFWNKYIMREGLKHGRKIMRLTYDMGWNHMTEPHIPDPRIDVRLDMRRLQRMTNASMNSIYYNNPFTGMVQYDTKAFKDTLSAMRTKHGIRKNRLETQAFYNSNADYGEQHASAFTSPYMQIHWGAKEPPRNKVINKVQGSRTAGSGGPRGYGAKK